MSEPKAYLSIVTNAASREATIYIYGAIGGYDPDTYKKINTADKFADEFKKVEKVADTIHVRINSPGGQVFQGLAIYNTLFASSKKIITYNDGVCASMAALILMAGDEIHAFSNSLLMIHNSSNMFIGNAKQVQEQLEASKKIDSALGTAIEERLGITAEEVEEKYLNFKDNWFTSKEAQANGFYDNIIKKSKAHVPTNATQMSSVQLFEQYAAMTFEIPTELPKPENKMSKTQSSFPNLRKLFGLEGSTDDTDKELQNSEAAETKLADLNASLQTALDAQAQAEADLQAEKDAHQAALKVEKDSTVAVVAALRAAATLAGVETIADDASAEDIQAALTAQINVLNKKPGATHTTAGAEEDKPKKYPYIDYNSSIYTTK